MADYTTFSLGVVEFESRVNMRGFNRDQALLVKNASAIANNISSQIGGGVEAGILQGGNQAIAQIRKSLDALYRLPPPPRTVFQPQQQRVLGASLGASSVDREVRSQGAIAGRSINDGVVEGIRQSESLVQAQFNKSITKAILVSDFIKFGLRKGVDAALGTLPGQISSVVGNTLQGGGLQESINIQLETNTAVSTLSALTNLDIEGAAKQIEGLNQRLAASAAALPGDTQNYKQLATVISDNLVGAFKDVNGVLDEAGYTDALASLSESFGALTATSTKDINNTSLALTRALGGASASQLRQFAFFEQNANALNQISNQLARTGVESLADLTIEGRVKLLEAVGQTLITSDFKGLAENSVDGLLQSFRSALFDPSTGVFGINRDLDQQLEGTQSVFSSFNEVLRGLVGQSSDDMGLLFRLADSAQRAGLNVGDPLVGKKRILDEIAAAIERAKTQTDAYFQSSGGQALIATLNGIQGAIASITTNSAAMSTALTVAAGVAAGPLGVGLALVATNADRLLPVVNSIGSSFMDLFEQAIPYLQEFSDLLVGLVERAEPLVSGVLGGVSGLLSGDGLSGFSGVGDRAQELGGMAMGAIAMPELPGMPDMSGMSLPGLPEGLMETLGPILTNLMDMGRSVVDLVGHAISLVMGFAPSLAPIVEAVTSISSGLFVGIEQGIGKFAGLVQENAGAIAAGFQSIANILGALKPGLIELGELLGVAAGQALVLAANLLANERIQGVLVGIATAVSNIITTISNFVENNPIVIKIAAIAAGIAGIVQLVGVLSAAWTLFGSALMGGALVVSSIAAAWGTVSAAIAVVGSAIAGVVAFVGGPVLIAIAAAAAAAVAVSLIIKKFQPEITAAWEGFKSWASMLGGRVSEALESAKEKAGRLKDQFVGSVKNLSDMMGLTERLAGPMEKLKNIGAAIKKAFVDTLGTLGDIGKRIKEILGGMGQGNDMGVGTAEGGAFLSGLFTGPSANIGGSSAYHIDTKISNDLSDTEAVALFDQIAQGYAAMGREIEFSNRAVAGEIYNVNASLEEKVALLRRASAAHSHSIHADWRSLDYYVPLAGRGRRDESTQGAEMLLPQVPGGRVDYDQVVDTETMPPLPMRMVESS